MEKFCAKDHACHFKTFFEKSRDQVGSGYGDYSSDIPPFIGIQNQRGYGIGNLLGSLVRLARPLLSKVAQSGLRLLKGEVKRRGIEAGKNALKSVLTGTDPKVALEREAKRQLKDIGSDAIEYAKSKLGQVGSGRRGRKRKVKSGGSTSPKKRKKKVEPGKSKINLDVDIFC